MCQSVNHPHSSKPAPLEPMPEATRFNERVHLDLIGPLPSTASGYKWLLVMSDAFSSYVMAQGLPNKETETVATAFLNSWISTHSICDRLQCDKGSEFTSNCFKDLCAKLGLEPHYSSSGHPTSNGQVERANRSIVEYFRKFVHDNPEWETYIQNVQFAMNTSIHSTKRHTPFMLAFGRRPTLSTALLNPVKTYSDKPLDQQFARLSELMASVHVSSSSAFQNQKKQFDKRAAKKTFQVGDYVYATRPHSGKLFQKFQPPYDGPFLVIGVEGHNNYTLSHAHRRKVTTLHSNRLKPALFRQQLHRVLDPVQPVSKPKNNDSAVHSRILANLSKCQLRNNLDREDDVPIPLAPAPIAPAPQGPIQPLPPLPPLAPVPEALPIIQPPPPPPPVMTRAQARRLNIVPPEPDPYFDPTTHRRGRGRGGRRGE